MSVFQKTAGQAAGAAHGDEAEFALADNIRRAMQANGYKPVLICTGSKQPAHKHWQLGGSPDTELYPARRGALNTGVLTGDVLGVDLDCDDPAIALRLEDAVRRHFGDAPCRGRANSPRKLFMYRAPRPGIQKRKVGSKGAGVELLGNGQQFVADGLHTSGVPYRWENDRGPHNIPAATLPVITEAQIEGFLIEVRGILASQPAPAPPPGSAPAPATNVVPFPPGAAVGGADMSFLTGGPPTFMEALNASAKTPDMNAAAQSGFNSATHWFDELGAEDQLDAAARCVAKLSNDGLPDWDFYKNTAMQIYAAVAPIPDGLTRGQELFASFSRKNPAHNDAIMERTWNEVCSCPPKQITPGTLLKRGQDAGASLDDLKDKHSKKMLAAITADINQLPQVMDEADAGKWLNERFALVKNYYGKTSLVSLDAGKAPRALSLPDFQMLLAPHLVRVSDGKGDFSKVSAAKWWTHWTGRRTFDGIAYDPENKYSGRGERILNTWRGLGVEPRAGRWRLIHCLILHVLCSGDRSVYQYLLLWLAHCVQRPGTSPDVMVVLRSDKEGMGKSTLGRLMVRLLGPHGFECTSHELITGQFNEAIVNISFALLEENGFAGDRKQAAAIKAIATAGEISINPKGRSPFSVPNTLHLMQTTNERWAVPAGADARRFLVLDVTRRASKKFFARLYNQIDAGGAEAFLHALLTADLNGFDPRHAPKTHALIEQQMLTSDDFTQWAHDCVINNEIIPQVPAGGWGADWPTAALHRSYLAWMQQQGKRYPMNARQFGKALAQLGLSRRKSHGAPIWTVLDLARFSAAVNKRAGIG
jgi:hypothetical protein